MKIGAISKLIGASVKFVTSASHFWKVGWVGRALAEALRKREAMVATRAPLAVHKPLAVQHAAILQPVINVLLSSKQRDKGYGEKCRREVITEGWAESGTAIHLPTQASPSMTDMRDQRSTLSEREKHEWLWEATTHRSPEGEREYEATNQKQQLTITRR